jgi:hypothetical protein
MKYRLLNEFGNRVIYTDSEREKNSLIEKGFHIDKEIKPKENATAETKKPKTKKKVELNDEGQTND